MRWKVSVVQLLLFVYLFAGCDLDLTGEKRDERRREAEERATEEQARRELDRQREAMTKFASGKRQLCKNRLSEVEKEKNVLRADLARLSALVSDAMSAKDAQGNDLKYESKILRIIRNPEVNALATKHLSSDFSGVVAKYVECVREARAADARYEAAVAGVEAVYGANIEATKNWSQMTQRQREDEMSRLEREISALEAQRERILKHESRNVTRHSLVGGRRQEQERFENRLSVERRVWDIESQIKVKRRQIDFLRFPNALTQQTSRALDAAQTHQSRAVDTRRSALADINRQIKPKKSLTETVAEFEADTVGKLRKTLSDKAAVFEEEEKELKAKVAMADEILLAIPLCDIGELRRLRQRLEK